MPANAPHQLLTTHSLQAMFSKPSEADVDTSMLNPEQLTALRLAQDLNSFFLTGDPGTGKTFTLLKIIEALSTLVKPSQLGITASTGAAANRLQGQTIHSWAGLTGSEACPERALKKVKDTKPRQEFLDIIPNSTPSNDQLIFVRRGIPLSRIDFTQLLRDVTAQYTDIEIGLLDYPHVIETMLAQTVHLHLDLEDETRPSSVRGDVRGLSQAGDAPLSPQDPTVLTLSDALARVTVPEQDCIDIKLPRQSFPATPHSLTTKRINRHSSEPPSSPLQHFYSAAQSDPFIGQIVTLPESS
ncbi:hypothetical protein EDD22DRAFT_959005 [Suillus occidentalis]|nr:hypothetical protein EDD22DRAFT_960223 [Suillus occidentalis]KAG1741747.1 hypothetical protein EDD22DRAFT_959005 [Suillus occidentalis]